MEAKQRYLDNFNIKRGSKKQTRTFMNENKLQDFKGKKARGCGRRRNVETALLNQKLFGVLAFCRQLSLLSKLFILATLILVQTLLDLLLPTETSIVERLTSLSLTSKENSSSKILVFLITDTVISVFFAIGAFLIQGFNAEMKN